MELLLTDGFTTEVVGCEPESELADHASDVCACLHEALESSGQRMAIVQPPLQHRRDRL